MSTLHVRHVRDALEREFRNHIDLSDISTRPAADRQQAFLSRALAALAVSHLSGCSTERAAAGVIDGYDDGGFDAVAIDQSAPRVWLAQAKWSDRGAASLAEGDATKMRHGLTCILSGQYDRFNARFQKLVSDIDSVISNANVRITLVVALMGPAELSKHVQSVFDHVRRDANGPQEMVDITTLGLRDFHRMVRMGIAEPQIELDVRLESAGYNTEPCLAYQGLMPASAIATWFEQFGNSLFDLNIRNALGITTVNKGLIETLASEPEHFLYYNNGITVLCDTIHRSARYGMSVGGPIDLHLSGASVVNGAQTVAAISESMRTDPDSANKAKLWVRLISLEGSPEGFAKSITLKTNTQNQVEPRDFVALDENQLRLRDEFALSLGKTYVIKRGDPDPDPAKGCTIAEAAVALACLHRDPDFAARAKKNPDVLYDMDDKGPYHTVFSRYTNAYRVWRSVELLRAVRAALEVNRDELEGRAAQIATHGDLVIAHIVSRQLNHGDFDNPDFEWHSTTLKHVSTMAREALRWLVYNFDRVLPDAIVLATLKNSERMRQLVDDTLRSIQTGKTPPEPTARYRRSNAINRIIDGRLLPDGILLEFRPGTGRQRKVLAQWLEADERRSQATWVNVRTRPLIWVADGKQYTPNGLLKHMMSLATDETSQRIKLGMDRWFAPGRGSLSEIADAPHSEESGE